MAYEFIELNLIPTGEKPVFHAAQYDVGRPIIIKLKNGEDDFTPTGLDLELQVRKVDNNIVTAVPDSVDGNVVTFFSTQQMTACSGTNLCEVQLSDGSTTIATLHFYLVVQRDVLQGGLTSQSEIHDLEEQIAAIVPEVIGDEYYTAEEVDEKIAEIPTFDPTNYYTKSQLYTKTETNGLLSAKANTSALSTVAFSGSYTDLLNKPTIPDVSNYYTKSETYNQTEVNNLLATKADTSSLSAVATSGDYDDLLNKPTIPAAQVQSDWSQADNTKVDYIKNKPTIPTNAELLPIDALHPNDNTKDYIDNIAPQKYRFLGKMLDSGSSGTMEGIGTAEITLSNGIARIDFNLKITVADTTDRGTWGICRDYFTSLTGKTITPVIGGSVMFYKADGTVNDSVQGYGGCAGHVVTPDNKEYWKFGRIYKASSNPDTYATGTWGNNMFAVNSFISGVVFGIYS